LYEIVPGSQVDWTGRKVGGQHTGIVDIADGKLYVENGEIIEGLFIMDMTSINATDIDNDGLDGHIKEWFNTEEYPTAEFFLTEASSTQVVGVLTMNGQSREISFPATVIIEDDAVIANADFALDRTQWGVDGGLAASSEYMELSLNLTWTAQ
jgi:polyisoprenoid-binding protein YceI